ncbi:Ca2+-dependent phosphoinositide-specific phospholipase C [Sunxiuqinia elliptica]
MNELTFDQITFKASHNSYDRKESFSEQLTFNPKEPHNSGCMGLELDIWRHSSNYKPFESIGANYFTVAHTLLFGSTPLSSFLSEILDWHHRNSQHSIILITLDIKSAHGGYDKFHEEIDTYLKCYFDEDLIFKPHQLMKDSSLSLCENVIKTGWPALSASEIKGKFIFCLSGNKSWKSEYAKTSLNHRYCFSDQDMSDSDKAVHPPSNGNIVFFNFHIHNSNKDTWMSSIPPFAQKKLITRTYISNSETNWSNCIKANVSAIATDKVSNNSWCKVSNSHGYREKLK